MSQKIELKVTGMSCGHCENTVNKALTALDGVVKAVADHKAQKAVVEFDESRINREAMVDAVVKAGYEAG
jgi:copper ion binding protein